MARCSGGRGHAAECPAASRRTARGLRHLYESGEPSARRFRYGLLALDIISVTWIILVSFLPASPLILVADVALGTALLAELAMRLAASRRPLRDLLHPYGLADLVSIATLLLLGTLGFLRVLRTLCLLHSLRLVASLRGDSPFFRRNEEVILATAQLGVFIFVMTGMVFETQHRGNPHIGNYADALYFTITALTTTGFGDITLPGTLGRMLTVVIMFCGVTLFLRLAQTLFRPNKTRFDCPACGLGRHDSDAVHCKACGIVLSIPDEGDG